MENTMKYITIEKTRHYSKIAKEYNIKGYSMSHSLSCNGTNQNTANHSNEKKDSDKKKN